MGVVIMDYNKERESCKGCIHDLGAGCCRLNTELECREGGGYELYESKGVFTSDSETKHTD